MDSTDVTSMTDHGANQGPGRGERGGIARVRSQSGVGEGLQGKESGQRPVKKNKRRICRLKIKTLVNQV